MKMNLLYRSIALAGAASVLAACGGPGEGYDAGLKTDSEITFADANFSKTFSEADADANDEIRINLLEGGMADGVPLSEYSGALNIIHFSFDGLDPEQGGVAPPRVERRTPFSIDGNELVIDVSQGETGFGDVLRENCDGSADPENPDTATYVIEYTIDNGYPAVTATDPETGSLVSTYPGDRALTLTLNAKPDVTFDIAGPEDFLVAVGTTAKFNAERVNNYACDSEILSYSIDDTTLATVDDEGNVTGIAKGNPTLTVTHPETGTSRDFVIEVNGDFRLVATPGPIEVPACVTGAIDLQPIPSVDDGTLTGEYTYTWVSDATAVADIEATESMGFGERAWLAINGGDRSPTGNVPSSGPAIITAGYESGSTSTHPDDIAPVNRTVVVSENVACRGANPNDATVTYTFDHEFEATDFPGTGGNVGWKARPNVTLATVDGGVHGNALEMTVVNGSPDVAYDTGMLYQNWGQAEANNLFGYEFGRVPESHGVSFTTSIWVKLSSAKEGVVLHHYMHPWFFTDHGTYNSNPGGGWTRRNWEHAAHFAAELQATDEWQLVNFWNVDGGRTFTVPTEWNGDHNGSPQEQTTVIPQFFPVGLDTGDTIMFDEYGIILK